MKKMIGGIYLQRRYICTTMRKFINNPKNKNILRNKLKNIYMDR